MGALSTCACELPVNLTKTILAEGHLSFVDGWQPTMNVPTTATLTVSEEAGVVDGAGVAEPVAEAVGVVDGAVKVTLARVFVMLR